MIPVAKPTAPAVLTTRGADAATEFCTLYDAAPQAYRDGTAKFEFASAIYAHDDVKGALRTAQHEKCAFCESKITHTGYGDVEHFRPKGGFRQKESDELRYPGYYWLAYTWANLYLSCQLCNQRFKRNLFPVEDGRRRARSHKHDVANEIPLLIDPSEDSSADIVFVDERAVPQTPRGRATIEVLGLNRDELTDYRLERLKALRALAVSRKLLAAKRPTPAVTTHLAKLDQLLNAAKLDSAEYAAMARAFLG
jgi:uncharacterized protein (TIGR02646 family)